MTRTAHGYGLVRQGHAEAGTVEHQDALGWFEKARLPYGRSMAAVRLGEAYLRQHALDRARSVLADALTTSRELGDRHVEGVTERLLGETFVADDAERASAHLGMVTRILGEIGARNELARALVNRADLRRARGEAEEARRLLEQALSIFERLGTLDEPSRVRATLATL